MKDPEAGDGARTLRFFAAGARVATTASYQLSYDGLARGRDGSRGRRTRCCDAACRWRTARAGDRGGSERCWVAASVGPYGAALADGSEYRGDYGMTVAAAARLAPTPAGRA